ncbi:6807_t:CDS:2 [Funneliformis geosporum]|uniref:453_t:CDS:1 n=1 Tax=Funneliformis geosporum TaxID=1117311 RepID=A0A9W4WXB6_9GLOM|nr:453_t:CDS:2 [Funneliformis geosporum]CAI2171146.1 6807_t:CDS:2 [Funneliformis geosporum]
MTRSKQNEKRVTTHSKGSEKTIMPAVQNKDRHLQRNGLLDPRGMLKKEGGGSHNWGKPTDELAELDEHYKYFDEMPQYDKEKVFNTNAAETNREIGKLGKLQVVKPEEFEALNRATNSVDSVETEPNKGSVVLKNK